jgi:hypothetical protein
VGTAAPATDVSLYEAMKYCNWLTTGDVNSGYYGASGTLALLCNKYRTSPALGIMQ